MNNPYEAPSVDADGRTSVVIPGLEGRIAVSPPGVFAGHRLYVDGQPAPKGSSWGSFALPDGRDAKLTGQLTRTVPTVVVDDQSYESGTAIPIPLVVLQFLPFVLVGIGGCLGGAAGGAGVAANMAINRQAWSLPVKVGAMIAVSTASVVGWLLIATMLALFIGG